VSDHYHESYEIYGLGRTQSDVAEALNLASGLREDLRHAEERIADLETDLARSIGKLWDHVSNMPGGI
jgi:hypothetical protein